RGVQSQPRRRACLRGQNRTSLKLKSLHPIPVALRVHRRLDQGCRSGARRPSRQHLNKQNQGALRPQQQQTKHRPKAKRKMNQLVASIGSKASLPR
ncbi:unnamed protein product, partial [Ectocarpus sp. 8 AP-2014]